MLDLDNGNDNDNDNDNDNNNDNDDDNNSNDYDDDHDAAAADDYKHAVREPAQCFAARQMQASSRSILKTNTHNCSTPFWESTTTRGLPDRPTDLLNRRFDSRVELRVNARAVKWMKAEVVFWVGPAYAVGGAGQAEAQRLGVGVPRAHGQKSHGVPQHAARQKLAQRLAVQDAMAVVALGQDLTMRGIASSPHGLFVPVPAHENMNVEWKMSANYVCTLPPNKGRVDHSAGCKPVNHTIHLRCSVKSEPANILQQCQGALRPQVKDVVHVNTNSTDFRHECLLHLPHIANVSTQCCETTKWVQCLGRDRKAERRRGQSTPRHDSRVSPANARTLRTRTSVGTVS